MGAALNAYTDFVASTGPAYLTGANDLVNDAQLRNYEVFNAVSRARRKVSGGSDIRDTVILEDPSTAATYLPGDPVTVLNTQTTSTNTVKWRHIRVYTTTTEAEIMLNQSGGMGQSREDAIFHQYKNLKRVKEQSAFTSMFNKVERLTFATASNAAMEAAGGQEPYSVQATITSDGLAPSGFTTVQSINPTSLSNWRNQTAGYTASTPFDSQNGIVAGFDQMGHKVNFKAPSYQPDGSKFTTSDMKNCAVMTNEEGRRLFMQSVRANNDILRMGKQDPAYSEPVFDGVPVLHCDVLDDLSLFSAGSPDYLFVNLNFFKLVFHESKWFAREGPFIFPDKPDTSVTYWDLWYNLFNCSRRRQGYLLGS